MCAACGRLCFQRHIGMPPDNSLNRGETNLPRWCGASSGALTRATLTATTTTSTTNGGGHDHDGTLSALCPNPAAEFAWSCDLRNLAFFDKRIGIREERTCPVARQPPTRVPWSCGTRQVPGHATGIAKGLVEPAANRLELRRSSNRQRSTGGRGVAQILSRTEASCPPKTEKCRQQGRSRAGRLSRMSSNASTEGREFFVIRTRRVCLLAAVVVLSMGLLGGGIASVQGQQELEDRDSVQALFRGMSFDFATGLCVDGNDGCGARTN